MALSEKEPILEFIQRGLNEEHYGHVGVEIITEVEFAPIIDAVQIVRCKDCMFWGNHHHGKLLCENERRKLCCAIGYGFMTGPNGYCYMGVKAEKTGD